MTDVTSQTLRLWRESKGWNVPRMARELRKAARDTGEDVAAHHGLVKMIPQWERGDRAPRERYRLLYLKVFAGHRGALSPGMAVGTEFGLRLAGSAPAPPACPAPARSGRWKPPPWPSRGRTMTPAEIRARRRSRSPACRRSPAARGTLGAARR